jgi:hypothetical protein
VVGLRSGFHPVPDQKVFQLPHRRRIDGGWIAVFRIEAIQARVIRAVKKWLEEPNNGSVVD